MNYYVYNTDKEGFLKVKINERRKKHRGYIGYSSKRTLFECWGEAGVGEMHVFSEEQINDKAYVRKAFKDLEIPNLEISELIFVPQEVGMGGHAPDFLFAFDMQEHFDKMDTQYLPLGNKNDPLGQR